MSICIELTVGDAMGLEGKIAVITGGGSGIGRATAQLFAREGATVVVVDKNREAAETVANEIGAGAVGFETDVGQPDKIRELFAFVDRQFTRLDILANNAGYGVPGTIEDLSVEDWDGIMNVNVRGAFLCSKYAIPLMKRSGGGAIVNTGSYTALVAIKSRAAYVTSKGAIASLTRAMALDYAHQNIRVNCVAPGSIASPWFDRSFAESDNVAKLRAELDARSPMNRMGRPEEIAEAILWLASDRASFATGSVLTVDGGTSIW
ncbi:SDR family oxidoreductase [Burkholderia sp. IMCC1007]|uniref:SDR family oxidoreductase n=1 Tax=Burkholderia sp. IMCC1007 TaxID=3004104 RepID=UPI0022B5B496|nr:SDR family oxidoreductase [Burkholderia sp. IMCC1007]